MYAKGATIGLWFSHPILYLPMPTRPAISGCSYVWYFFQYADENGVEVKIVRTESEQREISEDFGFQDVYSVHWTDECNYYCVIKNTDNDSLMPLTSKDTMFISITRFAEDGYFYSAMLNGKDYSGKLTRIEE